MHQIAEQYHLRRSGNRWSGQCPRCGGSATTDRFVLFDDGGFKCFSCGWSGSRITWLRQMEGMSCRAAHDHTGIPCATTCPHYGPCRQGQPQPARQPRELRVQPATAAGRVPELRTSGPSPSWQTWAAGFVARCAAHLAHEPEAMAWLAARGIDAATAHRHRLGWCGHDLRVDRAALGLAPDSEKPRVWVPAGLVIPVQDAVGGITRIKIRRPAAAREKFLPERKYSAIPGGSALPMVLGREVATPRAALVVEAELDAIACAAAAPEVLVVGLGSVAMGVPAEMRARLEALPLILVALDADAATDDHPGPGQAATARWWQTWPRARRYPVPAGKDPGDYVRDHRGDLGRWIAAALPVRPRVTAPARLHQDSAPSPGATPVGGEGVDCFILTLADGREVEVCRTPEAWRAARAAGRLAWSPRELADVQRATEGLDPAERARAITAIMDCREVFAGFVAAGRPGAEVGHA